MVKINTIQVGKPNIRKSQTRWYSREEANAYAIAAFAVHRPDFEKIIHEHLINRASKNKKEARSLFFPDEIGLIVPTTKEEADRRLKWLVNECDAAPSVAAERAIRILVSEKPTLSSVEPKPFVIGFFAGVIPPIGWGDLDKKKKTVLIIRSDLANCDSVYLAMLVSKVTARIVRRAILSAKKDFDRLEPEMTD